MFFTGSSINTQEQKTHRPASAFLQPSRRRYLGVAESNTKARHRSDGKGGPRPPEISGMSGNTVARSIAMKFSLAVPLSLLCFSCSTIWGKEGEGRFCSLILMVDD